MIQCLFCRGTYTKTTSTETITLYGIQKFELPNMVIYKCNGCGRKIMPKASKERLDRTFREINGYGALYPEPAI